MISGLNVCATMTQVSQTPYLYDRISLIEHQNVLLCIQMGEPNDT